MHKTLCKPCAVHLTKAGARLTHIGGRGHKITCALCERRRYGADYAIEAQKKNPSATLDGNREIL